MTTNAPDERKQFSHHLSLLSSKSASQRRDSLVYLTTELASRPVDAPLLEASVLLERLNPMILDGSNNVRSQLLKCLRTLPSREIDPLIGDTLLYIRAGITHLSADIRSSAFDVFIWAIENCPEELVSCSGGWVKTLKCLLAVLSWREETPEAGGWTTSLTPTLGAQGSESILPVKTLNVLAAFLSAGLKEPEDVNTDATEPEKWPFPLTHTEAHMLPKRSNAFAHLNLFGPPRNEETEMYCDREERQQIFHKRFLDRVSKGVERTKKEGGAVGRAAAEVGKVVAEGMEGFEPYE